MPKLVWQAVELVLGAVRARVGSFEDLTATGEVDFSGAENLSGFPTEDEIRGDYDSPAFETTVTLTSGETPAGSVTLPFKASWLLVDGQTQGTGTPVEEFRADLVWADGEDTPTVEFYWNGNDPGSNQNLDYAVVKAF